MRPDPAPCPREQSLAQRRAIGDPIRSIIRRPVSETDLPRPTDPKRGRFGGGECPDALTIFINYLYFQDKTIKILQIRYNAGQCDRLNEAKSGGSGDRILNESDKAWPIS